jgi:hypothetical protein
VHHALLESETAAVEVTTDWSPVRQRLRVRDPRTYDEVFLDPIELEGLTKLHEIRLDALGNGGGRPAPPEPPAELALLQNEFARVEVGHLTTSRGGCLFIRDLASRTEVCLDADTLRALTQLSHGEFAPLLDPSQLVQAEEPDPDQV